MSFSKNLLLQLANQNFVFFQRFYFRNIASNIDVLLGAKKQLSPPQISKIWAKLELLEQRQENI